MLPTEPKVGWVFRYSYLWHWQHLDGRRGDKDRPLSCWPLLLCLKTGRPQFVLPITHSPPSDPGDAIEIPPVTKRRLGLDDERSWIVLTESNRFVWPGPDVRSVDSERISRATASSTLRRGEAPVCQACQSQRHKATIRSD